MHAGPDLWRSITCCVARALAAVLVPFSERTQSQPAPVLSKAGGAFGALSSSQQ
jgi:hypothetical protein